MRPYEMMVLLEADLEDHSAELDGIKEVIAKLGGDVDKVDIWGKRRLAYPIDKRTEGYYALVYFKLDPSKQKEMTRLLSLRTAIVRNLVIRLDQE
ncbi:MULTISPECIES: 30S ribosomal protein S6 [Dethiosulfovibrio]|jgi:small subunit ribosomal protein S6|uniref:Small ribosomal subunit protein bS6 n=2 Tax=Dethiosulfovibrio TaxID=47054 RepID=A0ABS9EKJ5_9BACT|nr:MULTISPECIES: 30S ribosomal protein S6 [Dethiosulfovibrio]MCF4113860.1 30S ribosomal protein S6 [Dethiosulfovibrio russensis]MCF4141727.1 30S ribosomal protein S6 [Dethiosulfovibrio marinus]MCF4143856.1 30S ribosomal protein S6 [Dethiosulfovibrio acidaminovorans]MEA3284036.1 30S ribosomal protein S6 [Synergistota bacterium]